MEGKSFDVIIIGGGPIGLACGIAIANKGLNYLILEKGCLVNSIFNYPLDMTFFSTSEKLEIGNIPFTSIRAKANRSEALEYYRRAALMVPLNIRLYEEVTQIQKITHLFEVKTKKSIYLSKSIIIATGFFDIPNLLNIPGEELPKVHHYFREAHAFIGQKIVVVGAANSAVDVALESWRKGAEVTMVIKQKGFGDNVKYWAKPDIENRIKEGSIKAYFESRLLSIAENTVEIETSKGKVILDNDFVLAMTGYLPNFKLLESLGIKFNDEEFRTPVYNPETMETNQKNIFLAGVVCGGYNTRQWFIENSRVHAEKIAHFIAN